MDPFSNPASGEDLLPPDVDSCLPSRETQWHPEDQSIVGKARRFRFVGAWIAMAVLSASTIWSISWLQPQSAVTLSLLGATYEENLSVNQNIYGWNSVKDFVRLGHSEPNANVNHFRLTQPPALLRGDAQWDADWKQSTEDTLVVFCSAHGAADKDGPYLLTENADSTDDSRRVRITDMLSSLQQLPAQRKKLLVLDATHFSANWRYGVLHNDFARAMVELNETISSIPNLVVICASDIDQLSWVCEPRRKTVFGHYLLEAIQGAASDLKKDGRLDVEDVFQFTRNEVADWVQTNLQRTQQPMLLPVGEEGIARAAEIQLAPINRNYQVAELPAEVDPDVQQIGQVWESYHSLLSFSQKPYSHSPVRWRRYEKLILRYEQLLRSGSLHAANRIVEEINSLHQQLEWEQTQSIAADQGNLFVGQAVAGVTSDGKLARSVVDQLWAAEDGQHASIWGDLTHRGTSASTIGPLRTAVLALLYERAMSDPVNSLAKSARLVDYVLDPIEPPPSEINFLKMLGQHLPPDALTGEENGLIKTALATRWLGERTAVSWRQDEHSNSAASFPWIATMIFAADQQRLLGEDLLFSEKGDRLRAKKHFQNAKTQYEAANQRSALVRESLALRSQLAYRVPHMSHWIANSGDGFSPLQKNRVRDFETLLQESHKLNQLLRSPGHDLDHANQLAKQTATVSTLFGAMESHFEDWWQNQVADFSTNSKHDIGLALSLPLGKPETRISLLSKHSTLSRQHENTLASQSRAGDSGTEAPEALVQRSNALEKGQIQGRLALAMIGQIAFDRIRAPEAESFEQLEHRLHVFETEEHWWRSMHVAGEQIQNSLNLLTDATQKATSDAGTTQRLAMTELADFESMLGFCGNESSASEVNLVQRNHQRSTLFENLARREWKSRWHGPNNRPFYIEAADRYLQTSASLWPKNPTLDRSRKQFASVATLQLDFPSRLDLTTESRMPFQIGIRELNNDTATSGLPILWISGDSEFNVSRPIPGQRLIQRMTKDAAASPESCLLDNPLVRTNLLETNDTIGQTEDRQLDSETAPFKLASFKKTTKPEDSIETLDVVGFFRGQTLNEKIEVHVHATPDTLVVDHPKPETAKLAVKASRSLHGLYGTGSGALAIVLDASGSMGAPAGQPFGPSAKYFEATRALKQVLDGLPDGIQVSVWIFGQATGPQKTVRYAEQTIRRVSEPVIWNSADAGQAETLLRNLSYPNVEPWNESPIVETLLAAKEDLLGRSGFKSVLLLTDGMDNRFEFNFNRSPRLTVAEALRQAFDNSGIVLNIIGFKVESKEAAKSKEQFEIVESFTPPGKYVETQDAEALAEALTSVLQQRVRYWIDDYANQARTNSDGKADTRRKIEAGRSDATVQWYPENLEAASYALWTNVNTKPFNLFLERGDQLVVELARVGNGLECRRAPFLTGAYNNKPAKLSAGWKVAAIENRFINSNQLSMLVGMEKKSTIDASSVAMVRPFDVWFELNQQGSDSIHQPVSWSVNREFPIPAWRINATNWPQRLRQNGQSVAVNPNLNVWWSPDRPVTAAVRFERGRDYTKLAELIGRAVDVAGEPVVVTDLIVENRLIEVRPGVKELQPCLVVQLKHAVGQRYWIRPEGAEFEGYEGRTYESTGKYTGIFWPVVADEVDRIVSALEVVSLEDLKRQTEGRGCFLNLDNISTPRADDVAFPPLTGFSKQ